MNFFIPSSSAVIEGMSDLMSQVPVKYRQSTAKMKTQWPLLAFRHSYKIYR